MITLQLKTAASKLAIERLKARAPQAIAKAINRSIGSARTALARSVSQDTGIKNATVKERITTVPATIDRLSAQLVTSARRIPLADFDPRGPDPSRGKGRGISTSLRATSASPIKSRGAAFGVGGSTGGGRGRYPHAFFAKLVSGHRGVFMRPPFAFRHGKRRNQMPGGQLPIYELWGPSLARVSEKYTPDAAARGLEQLRKNLVSEFRFAAARGGA